MIGYVYILKNPAFPNLIKIGRTIRDSYERASELYTTGTPDKFILLFDVYVDDCIEIENLMHQIFSNKRYNASREFFEISAKQAIDVLQRISTGRIIQELESSKLEDFQDSKFDACLYHISILKSIRRIGFVKGGREYLYSNEFYKNINNYYLSFDLTINENEFYIWNFIEAKKFTNQHISKINKAIEDNLSNVKNTHVLAYDKQTIINIIRRQFSNLNEVNDPIADKAFDDARFLVNTLKEEIATQEQLELSRKFIHKI